MSHDFARNPSVVSPIRKRCRVPKKNRVEDENTVLIAEMAKDFAARAHALAQTEPNSEMHQLNLYMAEISARLPRNNLRLLTTREDVIQGIWKVWRQVTIAHLEWELCNQHRLDAAFRHDEDSRAHWAAQEDEAVHKRWLVYERLIRIPATRILEVKNYKLDRRFGPGMGNLEWMRRYKPDLAAVLDDELERLNAEKEARKAIRASRKQAVRRSISAAKALPCGLRQP
jgi:hypothetical protein